MDIDMSQAGWVPINFNEEEQKQIVQIGSSRRAAKEASGMDGEKLEAKYQKGYSGMVMAYCAECALAKFLGVEPDRDVSRRGNSGAHAIFDHEGREIVFNACYISDPTYDLRFDPNRMPDAEVFMLLTGGLEKMGVIGGISAGAFQEQCEERDYGFGLRLAVGQSDLTPARTIARYLGLGEWINKLDGHDRQKRLREKRKHGSLFGETNAHQDPA